MELVELKDLKDLIQTQECEETSTVVTFSKCGFFAPATVCGFLCATGIL
ncbi:MAG: hypothetical protein IJU92_08725 [Spirochaetaceae bacterium]|nr:hypothetical protein [Spirochaetaceae bacterium]